MKGTVVYSSRLTSKDATNAYKPPTAEQQARALRNLDLERGNRRMRTTGLSPMDWARQLFRRQTLRSVAENLMLPTPELNLKSILPPRKWRARGTMDGIPKISTVLLNAWPVLNQGQVYVLQMLAHFEEIGVTHPVTQATMARTAQLSVRTVRRALRGLVKKDVVELASCGGRGVKTYKLKVTHATALRIAQENAADHWKARMQFIAQSLGSKLFAPYAIPGELQQTRLITALHSLPQSALRIMDVFHQHQIKHGRVEVAVRHLSLHLGYAESVIQRSIRLLKEKGLVVDTGTKNADGVMIRTVPLDELGGDIPTELVGKYLDGCAAAREALDAVQTDPSADKQDDPSADTKCKLDEVTASPVPKAAA